MNTISRQDNPNFELKEIPESLKPSYFPTLNGIRGIAIVLVIMSHLRLSIQPWYYVWFNGDLGVNFFFVLSGFLITTLCLKEKILTGDLSLKNFYLRRILRIFPLAYFYLLVILILNYWLNLKIPAFQFLGAAFFILSLSYFRKHDLKAPIGSLGALIVLPHCIISPGGCTLTNFEVLGCRRFSPAAFTCF
jgi:peptidoglycan/LPS O-acetylase OafA/YrhL